jgi:hypothetical protein
LANTLSLREVLLNQEPLGLVKKADTCQKRSPVIDPFLYGTVGGMKLGGSPRLSDAGSNFPTACLDLDRSVKTTKRLVSHLPSGLFFPYYQQ